MYSQLLKQVRTRIGRHPFTALSLPPPIKKPIGLRYPIKKQMIHPYIADLVASEIDASKI
jgi:hypothetical protein